MLYRQRAHFYCPACRNELPPLHPEDERHVTCTICRTKLAYDFRYFWAYRLICALAAGVVAYLQHLRGPIFVFVALVYNLLLFVGGAKYILVMFPMYVKVAQPEYTTLDLNG